MTNTEKLDKLYQDMMSHLWMMNGYGNRVIRCVDLHLDKQADEWEAKMLQERELAHAAEQLFEEEKARIAQASLISSQYPNKEKPQ